MDTINLIFDPSIEVPWSKAPRKIQGIWFKPGRNILSKEKFEKLKQNVKYSQYLSQGTFAVLADKEMQNLKKKKIEATFETKTGKIFISDFGVKEAFTLIDMEKDKHQIVTWITEEKDGKNRQSIIDCLTNKKDKM